MASEKIQEPAMDRVVGLRLCKAANLWQQRARLALKPLDLSPAQFAVLVTVMWLTQEGKTATQADVAGAAGLDEMMTSQVTRALEGRRLVARSQHPVDGRARCLNLSEAGRRLTLAALPKVEAVDREWLDLLGKGAPSFVRRLGRITSGER